MERLKVDVRKLENRILQVSLIGVTLAASGCYSCAMSLRGAMTDFKVEKSVRTEFRPGSTLVIPDCDGAINISGAEVTDCCATATAFVHAPTKREAREIGEQLQLVAEPNEGIIRIAVKRPPLPRKHRFVSADLDIVIPRPVPRPARPPGSGPGRR